MKWERIGMYGLKSGAWCIGKIMSNGKARYVLSKSGGDSVGWFDTAKEAQEAADKKSLGQASLL